MSLDLEHAIAAADHAHLSSQLINVVFSMTAEMVTDNRQAIAINTRE